MGFNAQTYKPFTPIKGEITFREVSKITNKKLYDETIKISKEKFKESLKKSLLKEEDNIGREQEIEQMSEASSNILENTTFIQDSSKIYKQEFENSKIINFVLENGEITNEYDATDLFANNIILAISRR
ncbi:hypothetical protein [Chryseobacterium daeguense]|uniref:hypothetical protein n=1 Tax=Chryseobacterium daeguense TaxID=412438 RepID=UPI00041F5764|nr:hypothetical protein [Chryseobacterium daeguense]